MGYESSEIMAATALKSKKNLGKIKTVSDLEDLIIAGKTGEGIIFGDGSAKTGFLKKLANHKSESAVDNMAVGVSAAIAIRKYMGGTTGNLNVYLSGNTWPPDIADFKIKAFGFEDYNSADLVVTKEKNFKKFYGISLKKKKSVTATDPTLINKAVSSAFDGPQYKDLKEAITQTRINYFCDLVVEAVEIGTGTRAKPNPIILKEDIKNFDTLKRKVVNSKTKQKDYVSDELFVAKNRDTTKFERTYIDTKGYAGAPKGGYKASKRNDPKSMRDFVNSKLAEKSVDQKRNVNPLWIQYKKIIEHPWMFSKGKEKKIKGGAAILAEHLTNIILKTKLYDQLDAANLGKKEFDFALITGIGDVKYNKSNPKGLVHIGVGTTNPLKTTLCGLNRIKIDYGEKFTIKQDTETEKGSDAAKIYFKIMRGSFHIMDIRIRYKGTFNPKPQFQANMSKAFKDLLDIETCGP